MSSARNAGASAICVCPAQPSSGDRACRVREMQARVRCGRDNPLRRSCASSARNAEMQARVRFDPVRGEPSAEMVRVE